MVAPKGVIVKREFTELKRIGEKYTKEQKDFIIQTLAPTLTDNELLLFLYRAKKLGLNPLQGEITAHSRDTKHGRRLVIIIGKDGKARKAMQTGLVEYARVEAIYVKEVETPMYALVLDEKTPGDTPPNSVFQEIKGKTNIEIKQVNPWEGGTLWGAKAEVKRKNVKKPFEVVLPVSEYSTGELTKYLPSTMIKKTALSQCYTMAFPDLFAGVYVEGEVPTEPRQRPLAIEGGGKPATEQQIATIKALDPQMPATTLKEYTRQEAAERIKFLSSQKKRKK